MKRTEESANPTDDAPQDHDEQNCDDDGGNQLVAKPQGDDDEGNGQDNYGSETNNENFQNMMMPGSGDFNQMQMMMAMQNGMGGYSMMGMWLRCSPWHRLISPFANPALQVCRECQE